MPNAPYWQISFRSPGWFSEHVVITLKPRGRISMRACQWQNMWIIWCIHASSNFVESDLFYYDYGSNLLRSLMLELTTKTASLPNYRSTNPVNPRGANNIWPSKLRRHHVDSATPTTLATCSSANQLQTMHTHLQGSTWISTIQYHQLLCWSLLKTVSQVITSSSHHSTSC